MFDHAGDGFAEVSHWAEDDDAVLVWDRNGDGVINDGSELFGSNTVLSNGRKTKHGFEALAELDSNRDGKVDAADDDWDRLQVLACQLSRIHKWALLKTLNLLGS